MEKAGVKGKYPVFHGGHPVRDQFEPSNIKGDIHASRMMFHVPFPLVIFDTGTHLNAGTLEETEKSVKPYGDLGEYRYNYRFKEFIL